MMCTQNERRPSNKTSQYPVGVIKTSSEDLERANKIKKKKKNRCF